MIVRGKNGFSLLEILILLTIIGIFLAFSLPSQTFFLKQNESRVAYAQLLQAIQLSRNQALLQGISVTLCKSQNQKNCGGDWNEGYIILAEENKILYHFQQPTSGKIFWRAFPIRREELIFLPSGFSYTENGTFWYCDENAKNPSWAIVMNKTGRTRTAYPDSQGQIKDEKGKVLHC